ncbi:uncharacterized protein VTP21DRAFT_2050 [Calcarisporiella thermophila]|uniref:uncharacterized protein n=1 Tax=Calcarisporiella thermophila TaxID=911321 RepID=UPI0037448F82
MRVIQFLVFIFLVLILIDEAVSQAPPPEKGEVGRPAGDEKKPVPGVGNGTGNVNNGNGKNDSNKGGNGTGAGGGDNKNGGNKGAGSVDKKEEGNKGAGEGNNKKEENNGTGGEVKNKAEGTNKPGADGGKVEKNNGQGNAGGNEKEVPSTVVIRVNETPKPQVEKAPNTPSSQVAAPSTRNSAETVQFSAFQPIPSISPLPVSPVSNSSSNTLENYRKQCRDNFCAFTQFELVFDKDTNQYKCFCHSTSSSYRIQAGIALGFITVIGLLLSIELSL